MRTFATNTSYLLDLASVDRAKKGVVYPAETIYIQISAHNKSTETPFLLLKEPATLDTKFAVITPRDDSFIPCYFCLALNVAAEEWLRTTVGSNINISMNDFKIMTIVYTTDKAIQQSVVDVIEAIDEEINYIKANISFTKTTKRWLMNKMFV